MMTVDWLFSRSGGWLDTSRKKKEEDGDRVVSFWEMIMIGLWSKSSRLSQSTLPWNQVDKMQTFTSPSVAADPISQSYPKLCNRAPMQPPFPPYPILHGSHRSTPPNFVPQFQHAPSKPTQPGKQVSPCNLHLSSCLLLLLRSQSPLSSL